MYELLSFVLFFVGVALIVLVLVRKMPALAELPVQPRGGSLRWLKHLRYRIGQVDWRRYQRIGLTVLAAFAELTRRFFIRVARRMERIARRAHRKLRNLSVVPQGEAVATQFFSRIRRRSAYVEEERRLIERLTENPNDIDAYRRLGNLYVIAGNVADARAAFREILQRLPQDPDATRRLEELEEHTNGNGESVGRRS